MLDPSPAVFMADGAFDEVVEEAQWIGEGVSLGCVDAGEERVFKCRVKLEKPLLGEVPLGERDVAVHMPSQPSVSSDLPSKGRTVILLSPSAPQNIYCHRVSEEGLRRTIAIRLDPIKALYALHPADLFTAVNFIRRRLERKESVTLAGKGLDRLAAIVSERLDRPESVIDDNSGAWPDALRCLLLAGDRSPRALAIYRRTALAGRTFFLPMLGGPEAWDIAAASFKLGAGGELGHYPFEFLDLIPFLSREGEKAGPLFLEAVNKPNRALEWGNIMAAVLESLLEGTEHEYSSPWRKDVPAAVLGALKTHAVLSREVQDIKAGRYGGGASPRNHSYAVRRSLPRLWRFVQENLDSF